MAARAYATTEVPVERSREEVRRLLRDRGCDRITFMEGAAIDGELLTVSWVFDDHRVILKAVAKAVDQDEADAKHRRARTRKLHDIVTEMREQESRRLWRVISHYVKAQMVAINEGLLDERQAWLAHTVDPQSGRTVWDVTRPSIEAGALTLTGGGMRQLAAGVM